MRQGPLTGRYPAVAAMVVFALVPYLGLSAALQPLSPIIARELHMSMQAMSLALGMANAAYAIGTVFAVQFALRLPQRRMLLAYGVLLVAGSVLAASATAPGVFIAGHVLQGLCTSLLLIAALPPLIIGYPVSKARWTAIILNLCIFGAVALGPFIGGVQASAHAWRPLFWVIAGIALAALVLSLLTFEDVPPADRRRPLDPLALGLATGGCVAAFFGASELLTHRFLDPVTFVPLIAGLLLIVALLAAEYRGRCALLNVRPLVSTFPTTGILVAICAAAASVSAVVLSGAVLAPHHSPLHLGLLYLPLFGGAAVSALVFGVVFRTRALHYFILAGLILLSAGVIVIGRTIPPSTAAALVGSGLIGVGVGSAVTPALFLVGFSLREHQPAARVRDRRTSAGGCGLHDRAGAAALRAHGRGKSELGHDHRPVDLFRALRRRRASRDRPLRTRPGASADPCVRQLACRKGTSLGLATTPGGDPRGYARGGSPGAADPGADGS